jgi:hypothetical protein
MFVAVFISQANQIEKADVEDKLRTYESQVREIEDDKRRFAAELNLDSGATFCQMIGKVNELRRSNAANRHRADSLETELKKMKDNHEKVVKERDLLKTRNQTLSTKLQQLELQKRTYDRPNLESRTSALPSRYGTAAAITARPTISLINIGMPPSGIDDVTPIQRSRTILAGEPSVFPQIGYVTPSQYCILCRQQYHGGGGGVGAAASGPITARRPLFGDRCRVHYRAYRSGKYECCRDPSPVSVGCATVRHLFVEVTEVTDGRSPLVTITDGCGFRVRCDGQGFYGAMCDRRRQ